MASISNSQCSALYSNFEIISVFYFTRNHRRRLLYVNKALKQFQNCLLYTSDAADE